MKRIFLLAILLIVSACKIREAQAAINVNLHFSSDSVTVTIWPTVSVPVDSFVYKIKLDNNVLLDTTVAAATPAIALTFANSESERQLSIDIWSKRKGKLSTTSAHKDFTIPSVILPPPPPDSILIKITDNPELLNLFEQPDTLSPHFSFIRRTYTDFCYCWDGAVGEAAKKYAATRLYDLVMSGNAESWKKYNPDLIWIRYLLAISTLDEGNSDPNSLTGKWQADMRNWYASQGLPDSIYENAWLHTKGTVIDSSSRIHPFIWSTNRFFGNPRDSIFTEYTRNRLLRGLDFWSDGYFLDEMDHNNLKYLAQSAEFADMDTTQVHEYFANWIKGLRTWLYESTGVMPVFQTNAAGYSKGQFDKMVGIAAGSMHLELMNLATQEQSSVWNLIDELLSKGVYVDFVGAETWQDMLNPKWLTMYPGGNYQLPVYRAKVSQLASYYMVVPLNPQELGLQIDNNRNTVRPDSTDLLIYYLNVGHPIGKREIAYQSKDEIGQTAKVWMRDFDNARVLYRAVNSWRDTVFTDTTKVAIPDSLVSGYSLVNARGNLVSLDNGLELRNGEAAILIPTSRIQ